MEDQVTLPAYTDQVRELIKHDRNDEAIAICKHILTHYPKCVDAYRQMGEALLEKGDLDSAKDLFRRVLSADPENVVAYTGLAIIFDRQHLIDEAIWHLERAYELDPVNAELQKELLRLYNEADIKSHLRLKLTPGALGRIYAHEGLYSQALHEFRNIIAMAPSRFDIRVALAETLWRIGRLSEATQVAQSILDQLPYCLKANLILGTAWKQVGLPESEQYLHRVHLLDPTNQMAVRLLGSDSPLPSMKVAVPRYVPRTPVEPTTVTPMPEALTTFDQEIQAATATMETPVEPPTEAQVEATATPPVEASTEATIKPDVPPTTLPPWLQTPFPETPSTESESTTQETQPWLADLRRGVQPPEEEPVESIDQLPSQGGEPKPEPVPPEPTAQVVEPSQDLPTWLKPSSTVESAKPTEPEMPSWISEQSTAEPTQAKKDSLPAWLSELSISEEPKVEEEKLPPWISAQPTVPAMPAEEQALPPWISEVETPKASESEELPPTSIAEQPQVESAAEETTESMAEKSFEPSVEETPQVPPLAEEPVEAIEPQPTQPTPAWLENLAKTTEPAAEIPPQEPVSPTLSEPEQIKQEPLPTAPEPVATVPPAVVEKPSEEKPARKAKREPKGNSNLVAAREHRAANRMADALKEYDYIVQRAPRLVNQVIDDLEAIVLRRFDAPLEAHRILGDAYTRADRLNEALEQYRFVLEHSPK